ncbi:MAG TPA: serine--tRNA ligase [Candidatus Paceibacterota bacterium]|jgi:seryl-tRNA synthetase|nr:serine--tRNA ligase [Candidatus Paceibacterota bacterium]
MLDIKFIRENKEIVQAGAKKKHIDIDIEKLIVLDDVRLKELKEVEDLRAEINRVSNDIARNQDEALKVQLIEEMRIVKDDIKAKEEKLKQTMEKWQKFMLEVPNVPDISVPDGNTDEDNKEVKVWGDKPVFPFEMQDQLTLLNKLDLADFERGTKVSGFRGYFLKNEGALLCFALWQFFLDSLVSKGFVPMIVPSLIKRHALVGTGYIPGGEDDLYKTQDGDYLAGTGEVATMSYYSNEVLDKTKFPIKFASFSTCFRREAGSHGKDVKGFFRVHEFYKLEQVILCEANHEESVKFHEEITKNVEDLLVDLGLPYHIVLNCGGDLGLGQVKKYDIEVWVPSQNKYRETHSSSYFHDFQTRRLNIKYKDSEGKLRYAHSLNNTAIATPRIIEAILENYQQADGSVKIPEVLRKYMGGKEFIK